MSVEARIAKLETALSKIFNVSIKITNRGSRNFTISTEEVDMGLERKVRRFFGDGITIDRVHHDDECGTFIYYKV